MEKPNQEPQEAMLPLPEQSAEQPVVQAPIMAAGGTVHQYPTIEDKPDATDRWLEERGGGGRPESLPSRPSSATRRKARQRSRGGQRPEYGDDPRIEGLPDPYPIFTPEADTRTTDKRQSIGYLAASVTLARARAGMKNNNR